VVVPVVFVVAAGVAQAGGLRVGGFQLCGSSSSMREAEWVCTRMRDGGGLRPHAPECYVLIVLALWAYVNRRARRGAPR
jgi:hypothetical protein